MGQLGRNSERGSLSHLPRKGSSKAANCVCMAITSHWQDFLEDSSVAGYGWVPGPPPRAGTPARPCVGSAPTPQYPELPLHLCERALTPTCERRAEKEAFCLIPGSLPASIPSGFHAPGTQPRALSLSQEPANERALIKQLSGLAPQVLQKME